MGNSLVDRSGPCLMENAPYQFGENLHSSGLHPAIRLPSMDQTLHWGSIGHKLNAYPLARGLHVFGQTFLRIWLTTISSSIAPVNKLALATFELDETIRDPEHIRASPYRKDQSTLCYYSGNHCRENVCLLRYDNERIHTKHVAVSVSRHICSAQ